VVDSQWKTVIYRAAWHILQPRYLVNLTRDAKFSHKIQDQYLVCGRLKLLQRGGSLRTSDLGHLDKKLVQPSTLNPTPYTLKENFLEAKFDLQR
jgi:hypothetical protein